ncbi:Nup85 nucleoporin-domain-containing protein [Polychytrium aggregatum]|uniref:Nup85 nucleoporin-domain-containing protein n=1 Tax=Polychytrium aggregatum TaxID=110093 RepID=UPI0022FE94AE|nr:Nup85 nucleoporin-domain-containing protein [Polychytrium aggregatum]KAI9203627.1 Nup85 nucleoporin-domain-containing protein [Polychytrium aggregatum]
MSNDLLTEIRQELSSFTPPTTHLGLIRSLTELPDGVSILSTLHPISNTVLLHQAYTPSDLESHRGMADTTVAVQTAPSMSPSRVSFTSSTGSIFLALQSAWAASETADRDVASTDFAKDPSPLRLNHDHLARFVQLYLQEIADYRDALLTIASDVESEDDLTDELRAEIESAEMMHWIWHLCQVMFLNASPNSPIRERLLWWVNVNDPAPSQAQYDLVQSTSQPLHSHFWPTVHTCILRGKTQEASDLLQAIDSVRQNESLAAILDRQLKTLGTASWDLQSRKDAKAWEEWKMTCQYHSRSEGPADPDESLEHLRLAFGILAGNPDDILAASSSWQEGLAALVFYSDPMCKSHELRTHLETVQGGYEIATDPLESTLLAFFSLDIFKGLRLCTAIDVWLVSHLTDLISKFAVTAMDAVFDTDGNILGELVEDSLTSRPKMSKVTETACSFREWHLVQYGQAIFKHPSLWSLAFEYFNAECPVFGQSLISILVTRVPIDTDLKARKLLGLCRKFNLPDEEKTLYRILGTRAIKSDSLGDAITYFIKANEPEKIVVLADRLFEEFVANGQLSQRHDFVVHNITAEQLHATSDRLLFLAHYQQFTEYIKHGQLKLAGSRLIELLTSGIAPKEVWAKLLVDSLPLLESKDTIVFDQASTIELMRCLEHITLSHRRTQFLKFGKGTNESGSATEASQAASQVEKALEVVRFGLVRNLARAMTLPGR